MKAISNLRVATRYIPTIIKPKIINKTMKRLLSLIFALLVVVALMPSCEAEPNAPQSNDEPIIGGGNNDNNGDDNGGNEPGDEPGDDREMLTVDIPNWDFEEEVDFTGNQGAWIKQDGWHGHNAEVTYVADEGYQKSACVKIKCVNETTDMSVAQTVSGLQVGKLYELSAMIKTSSVTKGWGGSVYYGLWGRSDQYAGTNGWQKRSVIFVAEEESIKLGVRLGFSAGDSNGTAWFDNVKLQSPTHLYHRESNHVEIYLDEGLVTIPNSSIDAWLAKLDLAYDAYCELFPFFVPFDGKKMIILSKTPLDAWAYAGYPIQWNGDYVKSTLAAVKNNNDSCFGLLHEMGHNFAPGNYRDGKFAETGGNYNCWNWNEELFANFRMYYALGRHNLHLYLDGQSYTGTGIDAKYRVDAENCWKNNNDLHGAGMMWPLCQAVKRWGWEPFKATFEELYNLDQSLSAGESVWSKINYFFTVFSKHAGVDDALSELLTQEQIDRLKAWNP